MAVDVAAMSRFARMVVAGNTGYDQSGRWSFYNRATDVFVPGREADCSSFCGAIARQGTRAVSLGTAHGGFFTGTFESILVGSGEFTGFAYAGSGGVREGDFLLKPGHVVYVLGGGMIAEASIDEYGRITGGRDGNQSGRETRIVGNYGGWTRVVRPKSVGSERVAELNAEETKMLKAVYAFVTSADGSRMPGRIRNFSDWLTEGGPAGGQQTILKKILAAVTDGTGTGAGVRGRQLLDVATGGGPDGQRKNRLSEILARLENLSDRLAALEARLG